MYAEIGFHAIKKQGRDTLLFVKINCIKIYIVLKCLMILSYK